MAALEHNHPSVGPDYANLKFMAIIPDNISVFVPVMLPLKTSVSVIKLHAMRVHVMHVMGVCILLRTHRILVFGVSLKMIFLHPIV